MAGELPQYTEWLAMQRCCQCGTAPPSEVHHSTHGRGMSQRTHDSKAMPLCSECHRAFHSANGFCKGWDKAKRNQWQTDMGMAYWDQYSQDGVF